MCIIAYLIIIIKVMYIKVNLLVKYCLINKKMEYNIKGILFDKKIKFMEDNSFMIINIKDNIIERKKNTEEIVLDFNNSVCKILDKESNNKLSFDIEVLSVINFENYFNVKYRIQNDDFEFEIKIVL